MPAFNFRNVSWLALVLILGATVLLYGPWIGNPPVFDDQHIVNSPEIGDNAVKPFSYQPRQFPYFTLGFEYVLSNGNHAVSRCVALSLHAINGFLLFLLGRRLLGRTGTDSTKAQYLALGIGLIFAIHPMAVYGAGYLAQRTILFATLFLLLAALQFDEALEQNSWQRAVWAGLCFFMAAMSKEHAVMGFLPLLALGFLHTADRKRQIPTLVVFTVISLGTAAWIVSLKFGLLGKVYEPDVQNMIAGAAFPATSSHGNDWLLSAALQCEFFFRYMGLWLWPNVRYMSIDIRPDFTALTQLPWIAAGPICFILTVAGTLAVLASSCSSMRQKLIAYGVAWVIALYLVELSTVRIQEPIVLYRSYLWAPGIMLAVGGILSSMRVNFVLISVFIGLSVMLARLSTDRLESMSSNLAVWTDAASKLPSDLIPGANRVLYNQALYQLEAKQTDAALVRFEFLVAQYPDLQAGYRGRSRVRLMKGDISGATADMEHIVQLVPQDAYAHLNLGLLYRKTGQLEKAQDELERAKAMGAVAWDFGTSNKKGP